MFWVLFLCLPTLRSRAVLDYVVTCFWIPVSELGVLYHLGTGTLEDLMSFLKFSSQVCPN